jgi:phosphatidylinositol kinase/protein kinase (PI-3  family)
MLSNTPGDMAFEQAPFKLTSEYVQVRASQGMYRGD